MGRLPLIEGVFEYIKKDNVSFSMPGHKGMKGLEKVDMGKLFYDNLLKFDVTEVDGVDNLHNPEGIISEAQKKLSDFYGSSESYFLINGSTVGNLVMIFSTFKEGDKIIVERNCHKSIFNAIILRKLVPVYVENIISEKINAPLSLDMGHFYHVLEQNTDAKGIVITYPNYYGTCCDLKSIIAKAREYNISVLVDSAHGAHFQGSMLLPDSAVELGADMVVMSAHKTLPALNQAAFLHLGSNVKESTKEKVKFYLGSFMSTSPSYMIMCSMDYSRYFLENDGEEEYRKLIEIIKKYTKLINEIEGFHVLDKEECEKDIDVTRVVVYLKFGYSGYKLHNYLLKNHIQCEMNTEKAVVLIVTPFNSDKEMNAVYIALKNCNIEEIKDENMLRDTPKCEIPEMKYLPYEALEKEKYMVNIEEAAWKVSGENIVPYPPGVPMIMMGEIITPNHIDMIKYYINNKNTVIGVNKQNNLYVID